MSSYQFPDSSIHSTLFEGIHSFLAKVLKHFKMDLANTELVDFPYYCTAKSSCSDVFFFFFFKNISGACVSLCGMVSLRLYVNYVVQVLSLETSFC